MIYTINFEDVASSPTKDEFLTVAALIVANTTGHQARLRHIWMGPSDDIPEDHTLAVRVGLIDISGGSLGVPTTALTGAQMHKARRLTSDSIVTGGLTYGGANEPSDYTTLPFAFTGGLNTRGQLDHEWFDKDSMPEVPKNFLCGLLIAPRAAKQLRVSGGMEFEVT